MRYGIQHDPKGDDVTYVRATTVEFHNNGLLSFYDGPKRIITFSPQGWYATWPEEES